MCVLGVAAETLKKNKLFSSRQETDAWDMGATSRGLDLFPSVVECGRCS